MSSNNLACLQQEWVTLQNQFDHYERVSLFVKLFNVALTSVFVVGFNALCWAVFLSLVIWLQDGIWKTFQARMAVRLEQIEGFLADEQSLNQGMQFNSQWANNRQGVAGLVAEYIKQSLKPTVAYPHVVLVLFVLVNWFVMG